MDKMLFYLFGALSIVSALSAVTSRRILRAAVCLMFVLANTAALYVLLGAYFMAGLQLLVYIGGIVVLIVFAVMLTHQGDREEQSPHWFRQLAALIGVGSLMGTTQYVLLGEKFVVSHGTVASGNPAAFGRTFLDYGPTGYALPFEVISLVLLAAIIGGIVIARKGLQDSATGGVSQ